MEKRTISFIVVILLFLSFVSFLPFGQCEETVSDDIKTEFTSIQEAIDTTFEGDTVYIYGGEYYEDILINKSLTLEGKSLNGYAPVVIGNITIAANNVTVSNLHIQNGSGINIVGYVGTEVEGLSEIIYHNNTIKNNVIINSNKYGIYLKWAYYTNISGNTIKNNEKGIRLLYAGYTVVKENLIENNEAEGVYCSYSWENTFYKNIIQNNKRGFNFDFYFDENKIYENTIQNNIEYGLYQIEDNNIPNIIYHNNFINNTIHVYDGGRNHWNDSILKEGNYWDNYTGEDRNPQEGIGDTPYDISGGDNQDNYPLMSPYVDRIIVDKYYVNEDSVQLMLVVGIIVAIIFCVPIGLWWRKKYFK